LVLVFFFFPQGLLFTTKAIAQHVTSFYSSEKQLNLPYNLLYEKQTCGNLYLQVLRNTAAPISYQSLFPLCKNVFGLHIILRREATLCPNVFNTIRIFARISKFRCFHETKQKQNEVERFFYNLAEFVFECFYDSRRILASFARVFLNSLFAT